MKTVTAFCTDANDYESTMWVEAFEVPDDATVESMKQIARERCAEDWGYDVDDVQFVGLASGNVDIIVWEDV